MNFLLRNKSDRSARLVTTCRSSDPVDVILGIRGNVIVDDKFDGRDVESSGNSSIGFPS